MERFLDNLDSKKIKDAIDYLKHRSSQLLANEASEKMLGPNPFVGLSRRSIFDTAHLAIWQTVKNPKNYLSQNVRFIKEATKAIVRASDLAPDPKDRRFADTTWN